MKPSIYVNLKVIPFRLEDLEFLAIQNLHPELYFSGEDIDSITSEKLEQIRLAVEQYKLKPIFHSPFFDLNFGAHDPKIRAICEERVIWAIKTAKFFKAKTLVVHPGYGPWVLTKNFAGWLERAKGGLERIVSKAIENEIVILFENIYDSRPDDLKTLVELFPKDKVGVCFDIGHFNLFSEISMRGWLEVLNERILEIHIHDNLGSEDDHIAIGDGTVKLNSLIQWLSKKEQPVALTLEMAQRTHIIKSINRIREWPLTPSS